ncbi:beta-hexosaminidase subunit beta-like [Schistocerca cancellata]|uniref:beta-hexosaminidase subunit beta-like n=1 Tax=Schistocerca cancellata TaxID=274614 RepID=UPI002117734A|nr:beta-hexosaminidase subunit beta-like [Schistocerca cancellata]
MDRKVEAVLRACVGVGLLLGVAMAEPLPRYTPAGIPGVHPTQGGVWPKPQYEQRFGGSVLIVPDNFTFETLGPECAILSEALSRYEAIIREDAANEGPRDAGEASVQMTVMQIHLDGECGNRPFFGMNESYELRINSPDLPDAIVLSSASVWGILRGLETFSQVATRVKTADALIADNLLIVDAPRFSHRGLLLDTARHFIPISYIKKTLDAMAYNKMNVFHWHIVDDSSFPYQSAAFPLLSEKGSYDKRKYVYSPGDVADVIEYAHQRGIRLVPEFDSPGHTTSWGKSYPDLLTTCYNNETGSPDGTYGPIDPTKNFTYEFLQTLFQEIVDVFPDEYFHIGGDEVGFDCWESNQDVLDFMDEHNITESKYLESYYIQRILGIASDLNAKSIVWQEVFDNGVKLSADTVVQIWKFGRRKELNAVTAAGHYTLLSQCYYLDRFRYFGGDWHKFYNCEPLDFSVDNVSQYDLVIGGEAAMWSEFVDESNVESRVWPRASAVAERLWSPMNVTDIDEAATRIEEHYCRLRRRGINAQPPNGPGYCV